MGDYLSTPQKAKFSEDGENINFRFGASSMQGWRKRMEDSHIAELNIDEKKTHIFGVFDGHGGREVAAFVKKHYVEEFVKLDSYLKNDLKSAAIDSFLKIDELLVTPEGKLELREEAKLSREDDEKSAKLDKQTDFKQAIESQRIKENGEVAMFTGCTACVCIIQNDKIYVANAGDSRAVLCKDGLALPLSVDHKPELETERKRIYAAEGYVSDGRIKGNLNLSRSLGDLEYKQNKNLQAKDQMITAYPDIQEETLSPECDFMIIACDGIWDCKTNQQACDFVRERLRKNPRAVLSKIVEELFDEIIAPDVVSKSGLGCDNMTCVIVQFKRKIYHY